MPPSTDLPGWLRQAGRPSRRGSGARRPGRVAIAAIALLLFAAGGGAGYLVALRRMPRATVAQAAPVCAPAADCVASTVPAGGGGAPAIPPRAPRRAKAAPVAPASLVPLPGRKPLDEGERTRALRAFAAKRAPELRDCLDDPDRGPPLELGAAFEIAANGAVDLVQILGADGAPKEVRRCYSSHLKKWRFPEELLRGEEKLLVNFVL
jgi:hypothetical protein